MPCRVRRQALTFSRRRLAPPLAARALTDVIPIEELVGLAQPFWLSPPRTRACGFPALGSSRRLPKAGQGNLARVSNPGRRQGEAFQQRVESLPGQSALTPPAQYAIPLAPHRVVKAVQAWPVARQPVVGIVPSQDDDHRLLRHHDAVHEQRNHLEPVQTPREVLLPPPPGPPHHGPTDGALATAPGGPPARPRLETAFVVAHRHPGE